MALLPLRITDPRKGKSPHLELVWAFPFNLSRQRPTLPRSCPRSTIGAGGLNFRVRDGNGCFPSAMVTGNGTKQTALATRTDLPREKWGQAARPISTAQLSPFLGVHLRPINPVIFRGSSGGLRHGRPHLEVGFTLRCFQRLSLPNIATRRCPWRDSRNTRGSSTPVLSY